LATAKDSNNPIGTVNALTFDFGANEVANEKNIAALLIGSNLGFGVASYFGIDATVSPLQRTALSLSVYASIHTLHSVTVSFSLWVFILLVFKRGLWRMKAVLARDSNFHHTRLRGL
jgi:hypothetical protein